MTRLPPPLKDSEIIQMANEAVPHGRRDNDLAYLLVARAVEVRPFLKLTRLNLTISIGEPP
jgi:hypothetical protein